jgi:acetate kinase
MGFTPAAGLVMGTRAGDLDPGLVAYLARSDGLDAEHFDAMVNGESGLLGLSETSGDVRDLLARESDDPRAADALGVFCYQARKWVGALAAALSGLDTLVFSGGIGEHAAPLRARICAGLDHLGVALDPVRNAANAAVISTDASRVTVRVIPTDEELWIARETMKVWRGE